MTELEFYDEVINQAGFIRGKHYWSTEYLPIIYNRAEFRVKFKKRNSEVRLLYWHAQKTDVQFIERYEINPSNRLTGNENTEDNKAIYKDMNINNQAEITAVINWIEKYIPKMYNELS